MAMGRWSEAREQGELFLTSADFPKSPGHVFYDHLNSLLREAKFDAFVESECEPYYDDGSKGGRPSVPPGVYFRLLFVGYFEDLSSQRGIEWRCEDSLSLREFLGLSWTDRVPDHSSLTKIRDRLPSLVHESAFAWVLALCEDKELLTDPSDVGVDSTTIEANAAMRSIVRKDSRKPYLEYVKELMRDGAPSSETPSSASPPSPNDPPSPPTPSTPESSTTPPTEPTTPSKVATSEPTIAEVIRFDRKRKGKTTSNDDWESTTDPASRIAKMKDGRTHLAYKAEHVVDLKSEVILAAVIYSADVMDTQTLTDSVVSARCHLKVAVGEALTIDGVAADKGYHTREQLALADSYGLRTYVAEPDRKGRPRWTGVPDEQKQAVLSNRRRGKGARGKAWQRRRSEVVERSFAHVCETGGARRSWLKGLVKVTKRYTMAIAARNLGLLMRKLFGIGKPRTLQAGGKPDGSNGSNDGGGGGGPEGNGKGPNGTEGLLKRLLNVLKVMFIRHYVPIAPPNADWQIRKISLFASAR